MTRTELVDVRRIADAGRVADAGRNGDAGRKGDMGCVNRTEPGRFDTTRLRFYRVVLYLAIAILIAGASGAPRALLSTAGLYLVLGLAGTALSLYRGPAGRFSFWPAALFLEIAAHAFVVARMGGTGSAFLLLLTLPVLLWGFLRGLVGGISAAAGTILADALLRMHGVHLPLGEGLTVLAFHSAAYVLLGAFSGLLGRRIHQDEMIHEETRRELEQAQLDAETIVAHLARGLLCLDREGRVTRLNARAIELLAPFGGIAVGTVMSEVSSEHEIAPLAASLVERLSTKKEESREVFIGAPEGPEIAGLPCEVTTTPILDRLGAPHGLLVLLSDLTERRAVEAGRRQKERLAALGELSAGLAHEIRNSLKPITGSVELLREEFKSEGSVRDTLMEIILRESESLENFLTEFLNFARDKTLQIRPLSLEMVLGEELESLNALPESPFRLVSGGGEGEVLRVLVDPAALRQVVRNLGINALEAGGSPIEVGWRKDGGEAVIFLRDHGTGIPNEILGHVFEPFFTTKPQGTGLGLAIARDLVDRLGGRLTLEAAAGGGTLASIRLPLLEQDCPKGQEKRREEEAAHQDEPHAEVSQARAA